MLEQAQNSGNRPRSLLELAGPGGPGEPAATRVGTMPVTQWRYIRADERKGDQMRMTDLQVGWPVMGNDGRRIGTIKEVMQNYVLTSRPGFAPDLFVPVTWIANVENEAVHLNLPQRDAGQMGWEQEPRDDDELETGPESDLHRHI